MMTERKRRLLQRLNATYATYCELAEYGVNSIESGAGEHTNALNQANTDEARRTYEKAQDEYYKEP